MYDDIIVPTDGSEPFAETINQAIEVAKQFDATIHAVNVVDSRIFVGGLEWGPVRDELHRQGAEYTQKVAETANEQAVQVMEDVRAGIPHEQILEHAEEKDADLIIMGTHGRSGLERYMLGSTTEKVLRKSEIPVMAIPPGSKPGE